MKNYKAKTHIGILFIALMSFTVLLSSCKFGSKLQLKDAVETFAKDLPMDIAGDMMKITDCTYENNVLTIECTVDESVLNISALKEKKAALHDNVKVALGVLMDNKDFATLIDLTIDAGASLRYTYVGKSSKESVDIEFDNDELREIQKSGGKNSKEDLLRAEISSTNLQLPMKVDDVTILTSLRMEGADVTYNYVVEENEFTIEDIRNSEQAVYAMKKSIIDGLNANEISKEMTKLCIDCNKYLVYHYTGNRTSQTLELRISPDEIRAGTISTPAPVEEEENYDTEELDTTMAY